MPTNIAAHHLCGGGTGSGSGSYSPWNKRAHVNSESKDNNSSNTRTLVAKLWISNDSLNMHPQGFNLSEETDLILYYPYTTYSAWKGSYTLCSVIENRASKAECLAGIEIKIGEDEQNPSSSSESPLSRTQSSQELEARPSQSRFDNSKMGTFHD